MLVLLLLLAILGLLRCVLGVLVKILPGAWQSALGGNYLLSVLSGGVLFSHALVPSAAVLAAGIVLLLLAGLARRIHARRGEV